MKTAVTAASGHLGTEIVEVLKSKTDKKNIVAIARTPEKVKHREIETRKGDYNSKHEFDEALKGVDVLILIPGMDAPDTRIQQHRNVIEAAKEAGVSKILFSGTFGKEGNTSFDPLLQSYRETEKDIQKSGLVWVIGRNGLYIEPDIEYLDKYRQAGEIANSAGNSPVSYTTRKELANAYAQLALKNHQDNKILNLGGEAITQHELVRLINNTFHLNLKYREMTPEVYERFQVKVNGEMLGKIVAGIYKKIRNGEFIMNSDYEAAAGRPHVSWEKYFEQLT